MIRLQFDTAQLAQLNSGNGLTSCEPRKRLDFIDRNLVANQLKSVGEIFDVADETGKPVSRAILKDCFITTYGNPDSRLISGLGFSQLTDFRSGYSEFWKATFPKATLTESTELFVAVWDLVR